MAYSADSFTAGEVPTTAKWNKLWSNDADFDARITSAAPAGVISAYGGTTAPAGWLICNGSAVSRTTYAGLFAVIGTAYGSGDGSTTFNLPDGRGRNFYGRDTTQVEFDVNGEVGGAKAVTLTAAQIPDHAHGFTTWNWYSGASTGAKIAHTMDSADGGTGSETTSSNAGGGSHPNLGPYQVCGAYIIKT